MMITANNKGQSVFGAPHATRLYQSNEADPGEVSRWTSTYTRYDVLGRARTASEPYLSRDPTASQFTHRAGAPQSRRHAC